MGNIQNHNFLPFTFRLNGADCWDFHLSRAGYGSSVAGGLTERCLSSYIDLSDPDCQMMDGLYSKSKYAWDCAFNDGVEFGNIGFTGVDDGIVTFDRDAISNEEYIKLFTESCLNIEEGDLRLILRNVGGNNKLYTYGTEFTNDDGRECVRLKGGFFQGFFETDGYQVLPDKVGSGLSFEVVLKRDLEYDVTGTLNEKHPDNAGMFLYIGTRAENKWWRNYKVDEEFKGYMSDYFTDEYSKDGNYSNDDGGLNTSYFRSPDTDYTYDDYFADGYSEDICTERCVSIHSQTVTYAPTYKYKVKYPEAYATYASNEKKYDGNGHVFVENDLWTSHDGIGGIKHKVTKRCNCDKYLGGAYSEKGDGYFDDNAASACDSYFAGGYLRKEKPIDVNAEIVTKDGHSMNYANTTEIVSDNKFLIFDHGRDGITVKDWEEGTEVVITDIHIPDEENGFLLFNRTPGGMCAKEYEAMRREKSRKYSVLRDLYRNALGFRITEDGRLGYRYVVKDCDKDDTSIKVLEEYTNSGVVTDDKWHCVNVTIVPVGSGEMRISFYVDGKLKFVSKQIPVLNLKWLKDLHDKQESVPFNISLGGGTQGLCDVLYLNYRKRPTHLLPLEENFAGTFFGSISAFRVYSCPLSFAEIVANSDFEKSFRQDFSYL